MSRRSSARRPKSIEFRNRTARQRWRAAFGLAGALAALSVVIALSNHRPLISGALAQSTSDAGHDPALHLDHDFGEAPEPLYDGSVRPQDIPDSLAISVLMNSLRIANESDATALRQLQSKVGRVNLSEGDFAILTGELVEFDTVATTQEARIEALRPSSVPGISAASARFLEDRFMEEQRARSELAEERYEQLLDSLSSEGRTKLEAHLLHVKTRIRVFPPPDMSKQTL